MESNVPRFESPKSGLGPSTLFLGQAERESTPSERVKGWKEIYNRPELKSHQMRGYRTVLAWRITRALGIHTGGLALDERLNIAYPTEKHWTTPKTSKNPTAHINNSPVEEWSLQQLAAKEGGLALSPAKTQLGHQRRFVAAVKKVVNALWLERGSKQFPYLGYYGLDGLMSHETLAELWPTRGEILAFEDQIIEEVTTFVMKWSKAKTKQHLRELLGLTPKESGGLIAMATDEARAEATQDVEVKRFVMESRIMDYIDRQQEAGDAANELRGLKTLAAVQGLGKSEPETHMEELIGAMARVVSNDTPPTERLLKIDVDAEDPNTP